MEIRIPVRKALTITFHAWADERTNDKAGGQPGAEGWTANGGRQSRAGGGRARKGERQAAGKQVALSGPQSSELP